MTEQQYAVWLAAPGCLPDHMPDPLFVGDLQQCHEYVTEQESEEDMYARGPYRYTIEEYTDE